MAANNGNGEAKEQQRMAWEEGERLAGETRDAPGRPRQEGGPAGEGHGHGEGEAGSYVEEMGESG